MLTNLLYTSWGSTTQKCSCIIGVGTTNMANIFYVGNYKSLHAENLKEFKLEMDRTRKYQYRKILANDYSFLLPPILICSFELIICIY